jgi:hypothetical protein
MKTITGTLQTFLNTTTEAHVCDLMTITLIDGTIAYYTNADIDIAWFKPPPNGTVPQIYSSGSGSMTFSRSKTSTKIGTVVAEMDMMITANGSALVNGVPFLQFFRNGGLDGAVVRLDRLFSQFVSGVFTPVGICNNFLGRVSSVSVTRLKADIKIKSLMALLDVKLPKNEWQPNCLHTLYDSGCGLNRESFFNTGSITGSPSTQIFLNTTLSGQPAGRFTQGYILFTSGKNNGIKRTITGYDSATGNMALSLQLPFVPTNGDTFKAYAGCDHTSATCTSKFNNLQNFRGYEFVPVPQTAL